MRIGSKNHKLDSQINAKIFRCSRWPHGISMVEAINSDPNFLDYLYRNTTLLHYAYSSIDLAWIGKQLNLFWDKKVHYFDKDVNLEMDRLFGPKAEGSVVH